MVTDNTHVSGSYTVISTVQLCTRGKDMGARREKWKGQIYGFKLKETIYTLVTSIRRSRIFNMLSQKSFHPPLGCTVLMTDKNQKSYFPLLYKALSIGQHFSRHLRCQTSRRSTINREKKQPHHIHATKVEAKLVLICIIFHSFFPQVLKTAPHCEPKYTIFATGSSRTGKKFQWSYQTNCSLGRSSVFIYLIKLIFSDLSFVAECSFQPFMRSFECCLSLCVNASFGRRSPKIKFIGNHLRMKND